LNLDGDARGRSPELIGRVQRVGRRRFGIYDYAGTANRAERRRDDVVDRIAGGPTKATSGEERKIPDLDLACLEIEYGRNEEK
jgi:hypothetical protein